MTIHTPACELSPVSGDDISPAEYGAIETVVVSCDAAVVSCGSFAVGSCAAVAGSCGSFVVVSCGSVVVSCGAAVVSCGAAVVSCWLPPLITVKSVAAVPLAETISNVALC